MTAQDVIAGTVNWSCECKAKFDRQDAEMKPLSVGEAPQPRDT